MTTMQVKIGAILRKARQEQKYTLEQVARKLGKTKATISRWEKGERELNVSDLNNYLDAIKLSDKERTKVAVLITYISYPKALRDFGFTDDEINEVLDL